MIFAFHNQSSQKNIALPIKGKELDKIFKFSGLWWFTSTGGYTGGIFWGICPFSSLSNSICPCLSLLVLACNNWKWTKSQSGKQNYKGYQKGIHTGSANIILDFIFRIHASPMFENIDLFLWFWYVDVSERKLFARQNTKAQAWCQNKSTKGVKDCGDMT